MEAEVTVHIGFLNLCRTCVSIPCKRNFSISYTPNKTKHTMRENQYEIDSKENQSLAYEKQGHVTITRLVTKFRGYRRVKSCMPPTK